MLDDKNESTELGRILMKISSSSSDITIAKYSFSRIEEILGLSQTVSFDAKNEALGIKNAHIFTFGGVYLNDGALVKALLSPDYDVQKSAGFIFATLLTVYEGSSERLVEWIISKLVSTIQGVWEYALPALTTFTRNHSERKKALIEAGAVQNIASVFRTLDLKAKTQQTYELCFVVWSLSLFRDDPDNLTAFLTAGIIPILVDLLSAAPTRKIVRMTLASLRNLAASEDDNILNELYTAGLQRVVDTMAHNHFLRHAGDEEAENDFKNLQEILTRNYRELSSFDRWMSQVNSGALR
jgi:hypothetical protein